jgi:hypothetical protein
MFNEPVFCLCHHSNQFCSSSLLLFENFFQYYPSIYTYIPIGFWHTVFYIKPCMDTPSPQSWTVRFFNCYADWPAPLTPRTHTHSRWASHHHSLHWIPSSYVVCQCLILPHFQVEISAKCPMFFAVFLSPFTVIGVYNVKFGHDHFHSMQLPYHNIINYHISKLLIASFNKT